MSTKPTGNLVKWFPPISESPSPTETAIHTRLLFNGIADHDQAITLLDQKITNAATAVQTIINNTSATPAPPTPSPFPFLGTVNDKRGNVLYLTQVSDNGAKIILGDSSPITLQLNAMVTPPWFCVVDNDSSSTVTFSPTSGTVFGAQSMPDSSFTQINFDGVNFWAGIPR